MKNLIAMFGTILLGSAIAAPLMAYHSASVSASTIKVTFYDPYELCKQGDREGLSLEYFVQSRSEAIPSKTETQKSRTSFLTSGAHYSIPPPAFQNGYSYIGFTIFNMADICGSLLYVQGGSCDNQNLALKFAANSSVHAVLAIPKKVKTPFGSAYQLNCQVQN